MATLMPRYFCRVLSSSYPRRPNLTIFDYKCNEFISDMQFCFLQPRRHFSFIKKARESSSRSEGKTDTTKPRGATRSHIKLDEDGLPIDYNTVDLILLNKRLDDVVAKGLGISRVSTDKTVLRGMTRINGNVVTKRAHELKEGDEIDFFSSPYPENTKLAYIKRLFIKKLHFDEKQGYIIKVRVWDEFITDNWKEDEEEEDR